MNRWSHAEGDVVDVDMYEPGVEICEECNEVVDDSEVKFDAGDSYCPDCYNYVFGDVTDTYYYRDEIDK